MKNIEEYDIVVIDSGIDCGFVENDNRYTQVYYDRKRHLLLSEELHDEFGHGTLCISAISKHITGLKVLMVRIIDMKSSELSSQELTEVLELLDEKITCKIINMSLGVLAPQNYTKLYEVCYRLYMSGVLIVAAFSNSGAMNYPASFPFVIGVSEDDRCRNIYSFVPYGQGEVNVGAYGAIQRIFLSEKKPVIYKGNSLACAHFTGILLKKSKEGEKSIHEYLKELGICLRIPQTKQNTLYEEMKGKNACVFPFNKENHILLINEDMLPFAKVDFYDLKYKGHVGSTGEDVLGIEDNRKHEIYSVEKLDVNRYDVLILGHCDRLINYNANSLIEMMLLNDKYVISYDYLPRYAEYTKFIYPQIDAARLENINTDRLYRIGKPVLGIFGTNRQQGKFSLQLQLRSELMNRSLKVGQLGSEPSSLLFGMDECFHFGYNSSINMSDEQVVSYSNRLVSGIAQKENELIIVGGQSMCAPIDYSSIWNIPLRQMAFMAGLDISHVILCISYEDEDEYIYRSVMFLESFLSCDVVAVSLLQRKKAINKFGQLIYQKLSGKEIDEKRKRVGRLLHIPLFCIDTKAEVNDLCDLIEKKVIHREVG